MLKQSLQIVNKNKVFGIEFETEFPSAQRKLIFIQMQSGCVLGLGFRNLVFRVSYEWSGREWALTSWSLPTGQAGMNEIKSWTSSGG